MSAAGVCEALDNHVCCEVMDALDGLCLLRKRSSTLEGSPPVKAVQFCTPFIQGNAAGFQLLLADSTLIRRTRSGTVLGFTEELEGKVRGEKYQASVARLVQEGLLPRNSSWCRLLARRAYWQQGGKLHLWTGFLVRPAHGVWILVTGAFNRRCSINVQEHVIPDAGAFVPLIVTLELASARKRDTWLEKEVACLLPLHPEVTFTTRTLEEAHAVGQKYVDYFDERWDASGPGHYLGGYRSLTHKESAEGPDASAACQMVLAGGPNLHRIRTFMRFATPVGWSRDFPGKDRLQFLDVRNIFDVKGRWDGDALRDLVGETPDVVKRLSDSWMSLYGQRAVRAVDRFLAGYVRSTHGPRIGEPYLTFTPWALVVRLRGGLASSTASTFLASTACGA
jgi:hypothetical protein